MDYIPPVSNCLRMENKELAIRIKSIRQSAKISQEDLATRINRSVDAVSAIERGKSFPNYDTLKRLADAFGMTVAELLKEDGETLLLERAQLIADMNVKMREASDKDLMLMRDLIDAVIRNK